MNSKNGHKHDYNGRTETHTQKLGREEVTYEMTFCSCGKLMRNKVTGRRRL